jgi:hypothetical protein
MPTVAIIDHSHFETNKSGDVTHLCTKLSGISMVLFWTKDCEFCYEHKEIIKSLPSRVPNITFAMCNIGISAKTPSGKIIDKPVHRLSLGTSTVIDYVPLVIVYINGKPYKIYDGERTITHVMNFITKLLSDIQGGSSEPENEEDSLISIYKGGTNGKSKKCYLGMENAYGMDSINTSALCMEDSYKSCG